MRMPTDYLEPIVTYNEWGVFKENSTDKYYYLSADGVVEVKIINKIPYNKYFEAIDNKGNIVEDDDLYDYYDNFCCGEADDNTCYLYFERVD